MPKKPGKSKRARSVVQPKPSAKKGRGGRRAGAGRKPKRHYQEYKDTAGDLPDDPLAVVGWASRVLALSMKKIIEDPDMGEVARRQELRTTAKVLASLIPAERLQQAEDLLRESAKDMSRDRKDPEMTPNGPSTTQPSRSLRLDS